MVRRFVVSLALAASLAACAASSTRTPLVNAPRTPAADGTLITTPEQNGNLQIEISVKHLAPPEKVSPGATSYVVWVQPSGGAPQNVGALQVDQNLDGRLKTSTPYRSFNLSVTAESIPTATAPAGPIVLSGALPPPP